MKVIDNAGIIHFWHGIDHDVFNFAQFDSVPQVLNLKVFPAPEKDLSVCLAADNISCPVYKLRIVTIQRILSECAARFLRIIPIPHGKRGPPYTKFTSFILSCRLIAVIQDKDIRVSTWISDWDRLIIRKITLNDKVGAIKGNLDRSV